MSEKLLERVQRLTAIWGPSGRERKVARELEEMIAPFVNEIRYDRFGNLLAVKKGKEGAKRILVAAHMDTAGALALNISEKGLIYLAPVGSLKVHHAVGQRVVWGSGLVGVVQHEQVEEAKELDFRKLYCDIGAASKKEAMEEISLGDSCSLVADAQLMGEMLVAPGLDNRAGCAVLVEVAEHLASEHEVVFAFTVQGESTPRGAAVAAFGVEPDLAFVVDGAPAGDIPKAPRVATKLGGGPALKLKDGGFMAHYGLASLVQNLAEAESIPLQVEISGGSSEGQAVATAGQGVPTAVVGIPVRYRSTAGEMVSPRDLHGAADLVLKLLASPLSLD